MRVAQILAEDSQLVMILTTVSICGMGLIGASLLVETVNANVTLLLMMEASQPRPLMDCVVVNKKKVINGKKKKSI